MGVVSIQGVSGVPIQGVPLVVGCFAQWVFLVGKTVKLWSARCAPFSLRLWSGVHPFGGCTPILDATNIRQGTNPPKFVLKNLGIIGGRVFGSVASLNHQLQPHNGLGDCACLGKLSTVFEIF